MTLHLWKNSSAIAVLAGFIACGSALAGPNSVSISPSISGFSSMRTPDISMRSRDRIRDSAMPAEPAANSKKTKKTNSGEGVKKNASGKSNVTPRKVAAPVTSTPPVSGANLGLSPAGRKIQDLEGKINVPALGAVQDAAALPGALGKPVDNSGLPPSPRDPAGVGAAMNLPSFGEQAGQDARAAGRARQWMAEHYAPIGAGRPTQSGVVSHDGTPLDVWTWVGEGGHKVDLREQVDGWYVGRSTHDGRVEILVRFDRGGIPIEVETRHSDGSWTVDLVTPDGGIVQSTTRDSSGRVIGSYFPANPSGGGGSTDSSGNPTGASTSSGRDSSGNPTPGSSGDSTVRHESAHNSGATDKHESAHSSASGTDTAHESAHSSADTASDKPDKPDKDSSQPAEGAASNRNFFYEKGIVNPGDRPKQTTRGSDDRNIPNASGVIIRRAAPRTPEELKAAVTQPGLGDAQPAGGGGTSGPAASRFAQPVPGTAPGVNSVNAPVSGSGVPAAGGGLVPKPGGPAE